MTRNEERQTQGVQTIPSARVAKRIAWCRHYVKARARGFKVDIEQ